MNKFKQTATNVSNMLALSRVRSVEESATNGPQHPAGGRSRSNERSFLGESSSKSSKNSGKSPNRQHSGSSESLGNAAGENGGEKKGTEKKAPTLHVRGG